MNTDQEGSIRSLSMGCIPGAPGPRPKKRTTAPPGSLPAAPEAAFGGPVRRATRLTSSRAVPILSPTVLERMTKVLALSVFIIQYSVFIGGPTFRFRLSSARWPDRAVSQSIQRARHAAAAAVQHVGIDL